MAYSASAAERLRAGLAGREGVAEREMFGGLFFLVDGRVAIGLHGEELVVAVGDVQPLLREPGARRFDLPGRRPMPSWVLVAPAGYRDEAALRRWIDRGVAYASTAAKTG